MNTLYKSKNKMLSGVCAGLAEYFNVDITMIRIAYACLTAFTVFPGIILYIILALIVPET